ncbi:TadE/TadG family type IV pilus assembly protein [Novosphingobium sp. 9]|uniref:TadE/TadG family type IV pilus assembly protein n=1 Tax=Novosphingobium sp. 9 TaxID=2025349 RepID=UPI0021B60F12|nr:TadE/TadG family type IV pilus assembly protein [Novosphingobium sp. 9]
MTPPAFHHRPGVLRAIASDRGGVTVVEFALAAPVFLLMMMGIFDIGYMAYINSVLHGAVEQVSRNGTIETANTTTEDAYVTGIVQKVIPSATLTFSRKSYYDFTDVGRAESWNDSNNDGTCDNGESYIDENQNGQWDADIGVSGNGGADDVILYTATVTYKPLFPVPLMKNWNTNQTLTATSVRKNQPFATQTSYGSSVGVCK